MPIQLQREPEVIGAVRALLEAGASGRSVAEAMAAVVAATSSLPLANLDEWERKLRTELWHADGRPPFPGWKLPNRPERFASWLDLCSGDGFRRERILRSLSDRAPNAFFLALALRRLNDWVPEVRSAARDCLPHLSARSAPEHVVDALWYTFAYWSSWGRAGDADQQVLIGLMSIGNVAAALKLRIRQATAGPASHVLSQAGRGSTLDESLPELAGTAIQPSVRAKAYRSLFEERVVWTVGRRWVWTQLQWCKGRFEPVLAERQLPKTEHISELLKAALNDRSPRVRRVAAEFLISHPDLFDSDARGIAVRLAADSNATVAERGRYLLKILEVPQ